MDVQRSAGIASKSVGLLGAALLAAVLLTTTACTGGSTATGTEAGAESSTPAPSTHEGDLLARLQDGGFTTVIRHAETDRSRPDEPVTLASGDRLDVVGIDVDVQATSLGGPLVNEDGAVLGVLTGAAGTTTGATGGVAIPVDVARDAALDIVDGSRAHRP